ncbi:MAG TPA: haloalkane dehalogenase [Thermoanaerobaculia bacterium]|nr:haloalkane dehalogenase [Thermoanaerobaculia bacterium]
MWEFTRSMFRFSWNMSLFGMQQMANLASPSRAARAFDGVSQAVEDELGQMLRGNGSFRPGDAPQRSRVDPARDIGGGRRQDAAPPPGPQRAPGGEASPAPRTPGWGPMARSGPASPANPVNPAPAAPGGQSFAEPDISPDYPYEPHYVEVFGSKMHYITAGSGDPILLLHGNPTWSYLWRNIIPHLSSMGQCIAPDLIGFGRSDKPGIEYSWSDHSRYLEEFIEKLGLRNITLVLHDQGSGLGFHYASRHEDNVKGIAFFEALIRPFTWDNFSTPEFRELFRLFRSGGVGGQGWQMIVEQNMFIEQLLPQAAGRPLSEREMNFYREPFRTRESRVPVWRFPRQTAIGGEPRDVWDTVTRYSEWLQRSPLPKLMLYVTPGALITQEHAEWAQRNIQNLKSVFIGPGSHFVQESSPHRIGQEVAAWCRSLPGARTGDGVESGRQQIDQMRAGVLRMLDTLEPGIPLAAIVLFKVDPAKERRFLEEAGTLTRETRRLPGCNVFAFHKATQEESATEPIEYLIYEDWETRELFHAQWTSDHLRNFQYVVGDFVLAAPDLRFYHGWREYRGRATGRKG